MSRLKIISPEEERNILLQYQSQLQQYHQAQNQQFEQFQQLTQLNNNFNNLQLQQPSSQVYLPTPSSITNANSTLEAIEDFKNRNENWRSIFEECKDELYKIATALDSRIPWEGHYVPNKCNLFKAFELCPLDKVRVVIFGQDPYYQILSDGTPKAQGISFSVSKNDDIPKSLMSIYKEIKKSYPGWERPLHGDLSSWCSQGVLMLNVCLTCAPNLKEVHLKYKVWLPFITKILKAIAQIRPNCIYVMWGNPAQDLEQYLNEKSIKLKTSHPSGLSSYRGFDGCNHFKMINDHLQSFGESPIIW